MIVRQVTNKEWNGAGEKKKKLSHKTNFVYDDS